MNNGRWWDYVGVDATWMMTRSGRCWGGRMMAWSGQMMTCKVGWR
jgi:hypothetical protein